jgi:SAM-dependent methyltransferase
MSFGPEIVDSPGFVGGVGGGMIGGIVGEMVRELINPAYNEKTRRRFSIIRGPYRKILDPYVGKPYPLNCIGTFARLIPTSLESFVNIGRLISVMMEQKTDGELGVLLKQAASDDTAYTNVRLALRHALHEIGSRSYAYEWRDDVTFGNIDTLLEELASYSEHNAAVVEQVKPVLQDRLSRGEPTVVLDSGSGVGGTSAELLAMLEQMKADGDILPDYQENLKIVMYDVSNEQMNAAEDLLKTKYGFTNVETVRGAFRDVSAILRRYRGKVNVVISGAAFCHVIQKKRFFKNLNRLMSDGGVLSFWDPAISYFLGHRIKESQSDDTQIQYHVSSDEFYTVGRGQLLPVKVVRELADQDYISVAVVPREELVILSTALFHMYLGQMGYSEQNLSSGVVLNLKSQLHRDLLEQSRRRQGFDLINWFKVNLIDNQEVPKIQTEDWTPYDVIEAVSDQEEYRSALNASGFKNYRARRPRKPIPLDTREEALKSVLTYFYAEKTK